VQVHHDEGVAQALERIRNFVRISRRAVTHPRWEPYARIGLVRMCGGREVTRVPTAESDRWSAWSALFLTLLGLGPDRCSKPSVAISLWLTSCKMWSSEAWRPYGSGNR
jgi:hypothetical protein